MTDEQRSNRTQSARHCRAVAWRVTDPRTKIACLVQAMINYQEAGCEDLVEMLRQDIEIIRSSL